MSKTHLPKTFRMGKNGVIKFLTLCHFLEKHKARVNTSSYITYILSNSNMVKASHIVFLNPSQLH